MIRRLFAFTAAAAFLSVIAPQFALAQSVPSSAEPSRAGGQIAPQQAPGLTEFKGSITAQGSAAQAPAGADKVTLTLKEIVIEGASVYDDAALSAVYQDKVGTKITLADVYDIAAQLTAKYRNEGYILTQVVIPPQTIDGGTVRMRVVEGFVDKVSVEGGMGVDTAFLQGYAKKINASKPLNSKTLERYILLIN
ncbi:MAG TPA: POTRA domain-containing protein, partial [Alphaproteobacteria bacterium]|nr:POTRA domain-containing protein [Alphaproteobacteria bacterium]